MKIDKTAIGTNNRYNPKTRAHLEGKEENAMETTEHSELECNRAEQKKSYQKKSKKKSDETSTDTDESTDPSEIGAVETNKKGLPLFDRRDRTGAAE